MKTKKAILLEEGMRLFVALAVLVMLVYLAYSLYDIFIAKSDLEKAKATLKQIAGKLEGLEDGQEIKYLVTAPKNWQIIGYKPGEDMPRQCMNKNCLCICREFSLEGCEKEGVCKQMQISFELVEFDNANERIGYILINQPFTLYLKKKQSNFEISSSLTSLSNEEQSLIDGFLKSEYDFLDKGKINIENQILNYVNSGKISSSRILEGDTSMKDALIKNIKDYFSNANFHLSIFIQEEFSSYPGSILFLEAGKKDFDTAKAVHFLPEILIKNEGKKDILVRVLWRK